MTGKVSHVKVKIRKFADLRERDLFFNINRPSLSVLMLTYDQQVVRA